MDSFKLAAMLGGIVGGMVLIGLALMIAFG